MRLMISEILENTSKIKGKDEKIAYLRQNISKPLLDVIKYALDPNIKFLLPTGKVPYNKTLAVESQGMLYSEARKLYLFVEGGNPNLKQMKRETLFIQFLEGLDPKDAELIVAVKDKKLPYAGLNAKLIREAFPGLLSEEKETEAKKEAS
jgi:hypothetical protein